MRPSGQPFKLTLSNCQYQSHQLRVCITFVLGRDSSADTSTPFAAIHTADIQGFPQCTLPLLKNKERMHDTPFLWGVKQLCVISEWVFCDTLFEQGPGPTNRRCPLPHPLFDSILLYSKKKFPAHQRHLVEIHLVPYQCFLSSSRVPDLCTRKHSVVWRPWWYLLWRCVSEALAHFEWGE